MTSLMLAKDISKATFNTKPNYYIQSGSWGMQQKLDGERILLDCSTGKIYNRNGIEKNLLEGIPAITGENFLLDGEYIRETKKFYVFDRPDLKQLPYLERHSALLAGRLSQYGIEVAPLFITPQSKEQKFEELLQNLAEGVIFKRLTDLYKAGRSSGVIKCKFTSDIDCVVMERPEGDLKQNHYLGLYEAGNLVDIGKTSALTGDGPNLSPGDVCKVQCLYVGKMVGFISL